MKKIEAKIIADSINPQGDRITTYLLTFPRFILAELNTHRVFSKNSASSRAIPFEKMVKMVEEDPFIPIAWQNDHKGMQGTEYISTKDGIYVCDRGWLEARDNAIKQAMWMDSCNVTKQLCNRLLEPFMWHTVLVTATEWDNFFELRCPQYEFTVNTEPKHIETFKSWKDVCNRFENVPELKDAGILQKLKHNKGQAEIHIMDLAEKIYDAMNESTPKQLQPGEWHIPFGDRVDEKELDKLMPEIRPASLNWYIEQLNILKIKVATARCARLSYMTFDGEIDYEKDIKLHNTLLESGHASPFEHVCRVLTNEEYESCGKVIPLENGTFEFQKGWVDNFRGYKSYRRILNI